MMKKLLSKFDIVQAALLISLVLIGGIIETFSCVTSVILVVCLIVTVHRKGRLRLRLNLVTATGLCIPLCHLIACVYAVDPGMALIGFVKYLSVALFILLVEQYDDVAENTLDLLPYSMLFFGVISLGISQIPGSPFMVEGRLAGFLEYPNSYAMLLLVGLLAALSKDNLSPGDALVSCGLFALILFTGSRTTLGIAAVAVLALLLTKKSRRVRLITLCFIGAMALAAVALYMLKGDNVFLNRLFGFSFTESTFIGRLLLYSDSFKLIPYHPFGLGYLGYSYLQSGIQTGIYFNREVHNSVLQFALDIGWAPALLFVVTVVSSLFSKRLSVSRKIIITAFFLHSLFDFDLSYPAMLCLFLVLLDYQGGKEIKLAKNTVLLIGAVGLLELYFAAHTGLWYFKYYDLADALYPYNTENKQELMLETEDIDAREALADKILAVNSVNRSSYDVKAAAAYSRGDIGKFIEYERIVLELAPMHDEDYPTYAYKLVAALSAYKEAGDASSARICAYELIRVREELESLEDRQSELGKMIIDQPVTWFNDKLDDFIDDLISGDDKED